jgi:inosose dehydratase
MKRKIVRMKLAYHTNTWGGVFGHPIGITSIKDLYYVTPGSMEPAMREIAAAGYQGFELFDGNLVAYEDRKAVFRSLLQETGLQFVAVYAGANFIFPEILPQELWRIQKVAALAAYLGAAILVLGGGALRPSGAAKDDLARLADGLNQANEIARYCGLTACYHPHHGTLVSTPAEIASVLKLTAIALCPDTGHVLEAGGDPVPLIREYQHRIRYIHLKDYRAGEFLPLGQGDVDVPGILEALHAAAYDGWVTAELDSYTGPPKEAAETAMRYLRSLERKDVSS